MQLSNGNIMLIEIFLYCFFSLEKGHDSAEDAIVCIELVKHYLQNKVI